MTILRVNTIAGTGTTFGPTLEGNLEFNSQNYIVLPKGTSTQEGVLRTTADVVGTGGTYYDNLVLAMPFNAATGLTDVSSRNRNPAAYGNVAISTAQSKYYGSSAYFDGIDPNAIVFPSSIDWTPSSGVGFTIEFWFYPLNVQGLFFRIIQTYDANNGGWLIGYQDWGDNLNGISIISSSNVRGIGLLSASYPANNWYHFAASWGSDNSCRIFINGDLKRTVSNFSTNAQFPLYLSKQPDSPSIGLNCYMNDLRIYRGLAKYTANFTPPERISELGVGFKAGQLRYNTDSNKVELYDGSQWTEVQASRPDLNGGARGVFGGGWLSSPTPTLYNVIDYITISSTGNAIDFGDAYTGRGFGGCSSSTRGLFFGGYAPTNSTNIHFITISSTGNSQSFGSMTVARTYPTGVSNATRGVMGAGYSLNQTMDYVTITSTGNAVSFGTLTTPRGGGAGGCSSSTRGIFAGGYTPTTINNIEFITISTLGNGIDFGDLSVSRNGAAGCSNPIRGVFGGGGTPTIVNTIDYITIAKLGNAVKFGDLTVARSTMQSSAASPVRGVWAGGVGAAVENTIDYVTISTQGNAVDFGDLTVPRFQIAGLSNAHGGL